MPNKNTVSAVSYAKEIKEAVRLFKSASGRLGSAEGELSRAAALCDSLCKRAAFASKNIADCKELLLGEDGKAEVAALASSFLESCEEVSEAKLTAFLSSYGRKFESITLSLLPEALFAEAFLRISRLVCAGESEGLGRLIRAVENLNFIDFSRVFLAFSVSVDIFS